MIAAAGSGERLGAGGPKAFVPLAGRPMIEWSLDAFRAAGVGEIVVACPPGRPYEPAAEEPHGSDRPLAPIPVRVVDGGASRADSVANSLAAVGTEIVAIHDAARPLVSADLIRSVVGTLEADPEAAAAIAATRLTDTIKRASQQLEVGETLDRSELWAAQTPQVFRVEALRAAIEARGGGAEATDEATLVEAAGGRVLIDPAPAENLKVTTAIDLAVAEQVLGSRSA